MSWQFEADAVMVCGGSLSGELCGDFMMVCPGDVFCKVFERLDLG
jgi:hypothetical protein